MSEFEKKAVIFPLSLVGTLAIMEVTGIGDSIRNFLGNREYYTEVLKYRARNLFQREREDRPTEIKYDGPVVKLPESRFP